MTEKNWGAELCRAPTPKDTDTIVFSECGRVIGNVCHRSHWFMLVYDERNWMWLLVKHGGGEERIAIAKYTKAPHVEVVLQQAASDDRYIMLRTLHDLHRDTKNSATEAAMTECKKAFAEGRLRKRKLPRQDAVKVWIEPAHG